MKGFKLASNIAKLRKEYGITQEELAGFLGVTKASVSKWENGQSFPDIVLLPRIAGYFNITIDRLVGYEAQMSKNKIKEVYHKLAEDFATLPFKEVVEKINQLEREYYSCYPLLMQLTVLWLNHFTLAKDDGEQKAILKRVVDLCNRIIEKSGDAGLSNDAIIMRGGAQLQMNEFEEAISGLERILDPKRLTKQGEGLLIQAYQMNNQMDKAQELAQISMYINLLSLLSSGTMFFSMNLNNEKISLEILRRLEGIMEIFQVDKLHENTALIIYYYSTVFYCIHNRKEEALRMLEKFSNSVLGVIRNGIKLHGDEFFNLIEPWLEDFDLGTAPVRNERLVISDINKLLESPPLDILFEEEEYIRIKDSIIKEEKEHGRN